MSRKRPDITLSEESVDEAKRAAKATGYADGLVVLVIAYQDAGARMDDLLAIEESVEPNLVLV